MDPVVVARSFGNMCAGLARGNHVLVVDDNEPVRHLLVRELRRQQFVAVQASSFAEAVLHLRVQGGELAAIVTDWQLGSGPSGLELLELARRECAGCVRVMVSGEMDEELQAQLASHDLADAAFEKPWPPGAIATVVSELLAHAGPQSPPG